MTNISKITRRNLLQKTALTTLAIGGNTFSAATLSVANVANAQQSKPRALVIPPLLTGEMRDSRKTFDLALQNGSTEFFEGIKTKTSGINGAYLGPTLKMQNGDDVRINVENKLGETSTLHWHGAHIPAKQDGGPHQMIKNNTTWSPEFTVKQSAASLWYHPHLEGKTGEHVWRGMAAMLIIEDEETLAMDLPIDYGTDDIPLVLQDRNFQQDGSMPYDPSMHFVMMGLTGNIPIANGTINAFFEAKTNIVRFRILNGSNASFYNLGFQNNKKFHQIATDGGLLEAPVELQRLVIAPAERAEILVTLEPGEIATLRNFIWKPAGSAGMMGNMQGMQGMMSSTATPEFDFLEIRASNELSTRHSIPDKLASIKFLQEKDAAVTRHFELQMNMGPMVMVGLKNSHLINGKVMKHSRIDETVKLGSTEIWEIANNSFMAHPFHIHDVQFQILDRDGEEPKPNERGRKDVVLVNPGETVRLIMKFEDYSNPKSPYMYHCHILEHEDAGMMGQFVVI